MEEKRRPVTSQDIRIEEKVCIFDNNDNIVMFDEDNTLEQRIESEREIFGGENCNPNREIINRIEQQIKSSKENFFNVKVVKGDRPKKMMRSEPMQLASKNKQQAQLIIKEGFLDKKYNSNIFFKWNKRFFALNSDKLYCFSDRTKDRIIACVNFKRLPARLIDSNGLEIQVDFFGQSEGLILKCQNVKEKKEWTEAIGSVIEIHCLQNKMLFKTISKEFYEDKDSLTEKEFMSVCQTGDVLLFYTNHTGGKIQRFITQSDYDHVAMVVKFDKDEAMVFEANQVSGVALYDWKYYIHYFDLYQKVAIRKLKYIKKQQLHTKLLNFVKKNIGKKYDLSAMKLFKQESNFEWDSLKEQERGFFCSQLVAKAYKSVGLLEPRKASSKYWPVDFSEKAQLKLNYGAQLEREKLIVLNKHLKRQI